MGSVGSDELGVLMDEVVHDAPREFGARVSLFVGFFDLIKDGELYSPNGNDEKVIHNKIGCCGQNWQFVLCSKNLVRVYGWIHTEEKL